MAGIDSIIERIISDAKTNAEARIARANREADKLISDKKVQAQEEEVKLLSEAQAVIDAKVKQSRATQNTRSQRRLLSERVTLIDEVIAEAKRRISILPSRDRFSMIENFVVANCDGSDGILVLSKSDQWNIPAGFCEQLSKKTNSGITLSSDFGDFETGCILICGNYEYNGTLDALVEERMDEIKDQVNRILFK